MSAKIKFAYLDSFSSKEQYIKATSMREALYILECNGVKPVKIVETKYKTTTFAPMGQFNFEMSLR